MALIGSLDSGVSALRTFSRGLEVIGNNIANVNTTGYKGSHTNYADSFSDVLQRSGPSGGNGSNTDATQIGTGTQLASVRANFGQGSLSTTGITTDLGISGNGFFRVRDPLSGNQYVTRAGDFRLDDQGYLVTADGMRVQGLNDGATSYSATSVNGQLTFTATNTAPATVGDVRIHFDPTVGGEITNNTGGAFTDAEVQAAAPRLQSYSIDRQGKVTLFLSNGDDFQRGQVLLQDFRDPNALTREGRNLFSGMGAAGPVGGPDLTAANNAPGSGGNGYIESGTLETSNVDLTGEFANLITTQRAFQAASRIITVSDTVLEDVVNLKRS